MKKTSGDEDGEMCRERERCVERKSVLVRERAWRILDGKRGKSVEKLKLRGSVLLLIRPTFIVIHTVIRVGEKGA